MRVITPLIAVKVYRRIAAAVFGRRRLAILALKTLLARPGFNQRAVHREVIGREQLLRPRLFQYFFEEAIRHFALQQPLAILREHGHIPHRVVHVEPNEPAIKNVVVELLYQLPLAATVPELSTAARSLHTSAQTAATTRATPHPPSASSPATDDLAAPAPRL